MLNPISQAKRHDPDGDYVRRWIPKLRDVQGAAVHTPWKLDDPPADYPAPIVAHEDALARFRAARGIG